MVIPITRQEGAKMRKKDKRRKKLNTIDALYMFAVDDIH